MIFATDNIYWKWGKHLLLLTPGKICSVIKTWLSGTILLLCI